MHPVAGLSRALRATAAMAAALSAALAAVALPASAEETGPTRNASRKIDAVLELFTSQGCSSCPPADMLMRNMAERSDLLVLSMPVDYWDYIGWKDTLASPKNTDRQRAYARALGSGSVYTPQVVVNGAAHAVGSNKVEIEGAIERTSAEFAKRRIPAHLWLQSGSLVIEAGEAPQGAGITDATIWLVVFARSAEVAVKRGENSGRTLAYTNVVRSMTPVGRWTGKPLVLQLTLAAVMQPESEDSVVLIQENSNGPIVGAAWLGQ